MVNQDPQPEVFTTTFSSVNVANQNILTNTVYTKQGHTEQVMIYAIGVDVVDSSTGAVADFLDFDITMVAGANNVPTNAFDGGVIFNSENQMVSLSCPTIVNFKQPLQVRIETPDSASGAGTYDFKIRLIGETSIIKR